jgi:RimJ/RimL family protein N-acetyltransferase
VFGSRQRLASTNDVTRGSRIRRGLDQGACPPARARREARQYGIGERLIDAAVAHAPSHVEQLQLAVVTENEAARRLYAKAGFIEYGHQINALKHGARYYDDILMVKFLGQ